MREVVVFSETSPETQLHAQTHIETYSEVGGRSNSTSLSAQGGSGGDLMAVTIPLPPTRPHPSSVERRRRGKWLQTAPQEPKSPTRSHAGHTIHAPAVTTRALGEKPERGTEVAPFPPHPQPPPVRPVSPPRWAMREPRGLCIGYAVFPKSKVAKSKVKVMNRTQQTTLKRFFWSARGLSVSRRKQVRTKVRGGAGWRAVGCSTRNFSQIQTSKSKTDTRAAFVQNCASLKAIWKARRFHARRRLLPAARHGNLQVRNKK